VAALNIAFRDTNWHKKHSASGTNKQFSSQEYTTVSSRPQTRSTHGQTVKGKGPIKSVTSPLRNIINNACVTEAARRGVSKTLQEFNTFSTTTNPFHITNQYLHPQVLNLSIW
jgi:hypothetical protein